MKRQVHLLVTVSFNSQPDPERPSTGMGEDEIADKVKDRLDNILREEALDVDPHATVSYRGVSVHNVEDDPNADE